MKKMDGLKREKVQKEIDGLMSNKKSAENKSEYLSKVRDELLPILDLKLN